tara:strand:- start:2016 stop:2387 length:372 start_codon:yes stop_codon:yes gene_type:complete
MIDRTIYIGRNTKFVNKSWGSELWIVNDKENDYCGKILEIDPGKGTSLHFHSNKHETFFVLEGDLELTIIDTETCEPSLICLRKGDTFVLDRNVPHRLEASGGCKVMEISTFHEDSDSYRVMK